MTPDFELGSWLGRRQAMATCAARATASDVACLRYIRDHKLYKAHTSTWADFCSNYIGASKTQIDLDIRNAEEFGDQFFILNQLTRVSPAAYRAISPNITREGIVFRGEIIPFTESRITEISQAVDTLHRELPTAPKPRLNVSRALQILQSAVSQLEIHYATLTPAQRFVVSAVARRLSPVGHAPAGLGRPPDASPAFPRHPSRGRRPGAPQRPYPTPMLCRMSRPCSALLRGAGEGAAGGAVHKVLYTSYPLTLPRAPAHPRSVSQYSI